MLARLGSARLGRRSVLARGAALAGACCAAAHAAASTTASEAPKKRPLALPPVGLGLWKSAPGEVGTAVKEALLFGCRLLDGAAGYANEAEVGEALAESLRERVLQRSDVWVVSKLFNTHHVWDSESTWRPAAALDKTLKELRVDHLDLYLMHWPVAIEQTEIASLGGLRLADGTPNPKLNYKLEYLDTWREMLKLKKAGKVTHLGVCNFTIEQ